MNALKNCTLTEVAKQNKFFYATQPEINLDTD